MTHKVVTTIILILSTILLHGQGGGYVNGGLVWGKNKFEGVTPNGERHVGFKAGVDMSLNSGNMFFLPGFHYMRVGFNTERSTFFSPVIPLEIIKGRFGLGFILHHGRRIKVRSKVQGAMHWVINAHTIDLNNSKLNEGYAGVDLGLGLSIGALTIDVEYEKGVINSVYKISSSHFDFLYATIGFFF